MEQDSEEELIEQDYLTEYNENEFAQSEIKKNYFVEQVEKIRSNNLTEFTLINHSINDKDAKKLCDALKTNDRNSLTALHLTQQTHIDYDEGNEDFLDNKPFIEMLKVFLDGNNKLKSLIFSNFRIGDKNVKLLNSSFKNSQSLTALDLSKNDIGFDGVLVLSETLRGNTILISLNLSKNAMKIEAIKVLCLALKQNHTLESLGLSNTISDNFDHKGIKKIISILANPNSALTVLDFSNNSINSTNLKKLTDILAKNENLTSLPLTIKLSSTTPLPYTPYTHLGGGSIIPDINILYLNRMLVDNQTLQSFGDAFDKVTTALLAVNKKNSQAENNHFITHTRQWYNEKVKIYNKDKPKNQQKEEQKIEVPTLTDICLHYVKHNIFTCKKEKLADLQEKLKVLPEDLQEKLQNTSRFFYPSIALRTRTAERSAKEPVAKKSKFSR